MSMIKLEDALAQLKAMFPEFPDTLIRKRLLEQNGHLESTIDTLLAETFAASSSVAAASSAPSVRPPAPSIASASASLLPPDFLSVPPSSSRQIALRFPQGDEAGGHHWMKGWHIDGISTPSNGVPEGPLHNFTMLMGIYLSESQPMGGNLAVFPGSHHKIEAEVRRKGSSDAVFRGESSWHRSIEGVPGQPVQICAQPGDVVFAHYQLAHTVVPNLSPFVRYAVYFRLTSKSRPAAHQHHYEDAMHEIWMEYMGMWPVVAQHEGSKPYMEKS